jgi:hypothetical protein
MAVKWKLADHNYGCTAMVELEINDREFVFFPSSYTFKLSMDFCSLTSLGFVNELLLVKVEDNWLGTKYGRRHERSVC